MTFDVSQEVIILLNKVDKFENQCNAYDVEEAIATLTGKSTFVFSAKEKRYLDKILSTIESLANAKYGTNNLVVTNVRHLEAFTIAEKSLAEIKNGISQNLSGDLLSVEIKTTLNALGSITGVISNEDVLGSIFSKFCIGK